MTARSSLLLLTDFFFHYKVPKEEEKEEENEQKNYKKYKNHFILFMCDIKNHMNLASSIGSSLSRVSSSSPSSTPTDSESQSHVGHVVLQTINSNHTNIPTSISMQNNHVLHNICNSARSSGQEEEIAPPIASRPERTKSIVSLNMS